MKLIRFPLAASVGWVILTRVLAATGPGAVAALDPDAFLRTYCRFSNADLERVARGEPAARPLDTDSAEVAICAAIDAAVPPSFYLARFRNIEAFKKGDMVRKVHRFGSLPSPADLAALTIDDDDIDDLRKCHPGDCDMKLDAEGMARTRSVQASGAGAAPRLLEVYREHLAAYAARYMTRGDQALLEYRDGSKPQSVASELRLIIEHSPYLVRELPQLAAGISPFSGVLPPGLDGFLYWSLEEVGPRRVVSITHAIVSAPRAGPIAIATKQIYGSHYFTASLGLTILADVSTAAAPRTRMIYINRSRVDTFGGVLGGVKRAIARSRARKGADHTLSALKTRLEAAFRQPPGG